MKSKIATKFKSFNESMYSEEMEAKRMKRNQDRIDGKGGPGSFEYALGQAYKLASPGNRERMDKAFPEFFGYEGLGESVHSEEMEAKRMKRNQDRIDGKGGPGSFEYALGQAYKLASDGNRQRLDDAFPEFFGYEGLEESMHSEEMEAKRMKRNQYTFGVYTRDEFGSVDPNSQQIVKQHATNSTAARDLVKKKYPGFKYFVELIS